MDKEMVIKGCEYWVNHHKDENFLLTYSSVVELLAALKEQEDTINELQNAYGYLQKQFFEVQDKLLKEREAIEPYMDYDGQDVWRCGTCGNSLMHPSYYESDEDAKNHIRYCSHCGQAVKWK